LDLFPALLGVNQQFAITIAVSVIISAFVALSLNLRLFYYLKPSKMTKQEKIFFERFFTRF